MPSGRAALAAALLVSGCGSGTADGRVAFSQVEVQAYLEREAARTLPGLEVGAASCPPELPEKVGGSAMCTVRVEGVVLQYEVQRLVGGRFEARPQRPIVLVSDLDTAVRSKLGAPSAQVRCGDAAVVQPAPGQPLLCEISGGGPTRTATVQVEADGTITVTGA